MSYTSLMVHLNLGQSNKNLLEVTKTLARRFDARVIGIAGAHPSQMVYSEGYAADDIWALELKEIAELLDAAKTEFCNAFGHDSAGDTPEHRMQWRGTDRYGLLSEYAARESRCADLIIKGLRKEDIPDRSTLINTVDLILRVGKPVLVVPPDVSPPRFDWVLVAWKDTREARRAVADALPLLKIAQHVRVLEIAPQSELAQAQARLDDVVGWLKTHGVAAEAAPTLLNPDNNDQLGSIATECGADLVVAGAYGHSRMREWVMGGFTRSLLHGTQRCTLLSH